MFLVVCKFNHLDNAVFSCFLLGDCLVAQTSFLLWSVRDQRTFIPAIWIICGLFLPISTLA
ncbi:hypothetical protein F5Y17DRAFT_420092 [Xylariaceae sp. FL0594]|nr:hypothetical protein F5Y17DRAFT_420092 [Xylariaceae sp. FL0594]